VAAALGLPDPGRALAQTELQEWTTAGQRLRERDPQRFRTALAFFQDWVRTDEKRVDFLASFSNGGDIVGDTPDSDPLPVKKRR
jgi:hypothetical protein